MTAASRTLSRRAFGRTAAAGLAAACLSARSSAAPASALATIYERRGYDLSGVTLPGAGDTFPTDELRKMRFRRLAPLDVFPEGPTYDRRGGRYYFSGNDALSRVETDGEVETLMQRPGGGGTHVLPDGSILIVGKTGLRRRYVDGRVATLVGEDAVSGGNDLSVGVYGEVYFSVPRDGIYRLTPNPGGALSKVCDQGANGLEVDPAGKFLYVAGGDVRRYPIDIAADSLGEPEVVYAFPKGGRGTVPSGGDGCTFDAWGHFYSMHFKTGTVRVFDPAAGTLIEQIAIGVAPATNLCFGGPDCRDLLVTAGTPKRGNCQILIAASGITGFCGHVGAVDYPVRSPSPKSP